MAKTLEQYTAEATQAYLPSQKAIQNQLGSLDSQYATGEQKINRQYAQRQSQLENQRNQAAEAASLQAAGSGGSFGGTANIANRKYYEQSFVPAQTQLQTNQSNDIDTLRQNIENQRASLNSQLANLQAQANQQALQQYWAEVEAERERENQRRLAAQQNSAQNAYYNALMKSMQNANNGDGVKTWDFGNGYKAYSGADGEAVYTLNGNEVTRGRFLQGTGANGANWNLWKDIWNSGTRTNGVGSDTIAAFNRVSPTDSKYNYLF